MTKTTATQTHPGDAISRRKHTAQMNAIELAKVFAAHYGWRGTAGGWIRDTAGNPICQGWDCLADALVMRRWIEVGVGIDWRRAGESPRLVRRSGGRAY